MWGFLAVGFFMVTLIVRGKVGFQAFGKFTPREHDSAPAPFTFQADVCTEAGDGPFVGAARVLLAQAQVIVEVEGGEHGVIGN